MIRRRRNSVQAPSCLGDSGTPAAAERTKAQAHYSKIPAPSKSYRFSVYASEEVKDALDRLFAKKCAYCEFKRAGAPFDVEHFRPKGLVVDNGAEIFPAYWWLASRWANLLPSCQDCNRMRYQHVQGGRYKYGKENKFPLRAGSRRAGAPGDEAHEQPLLIDPTVDNPRDHMRFFVGPSLVGQEGCFISPVVDSNGQADERGLATIETVGLDRPSLVNQRMEHIKLLRLALRSIEKEWARYKLSGSEDRKADILADIRREQKEIADTFLSWRSPYSEACRTEYRRWIAGIRARAST